MLLTDLPHFAFKQENNKVPFTKEGSDAESKLWPTVKHCHFSLSGICTPWPWPHGVFEKLIFPSLLHLFWVADDLLMLMCVSWCFSWRRRIVQYSNTAEEQQRATFLCTCLARTTKLCTLCTTFSSFCVYLWHCLIRMAVPWRQGIFNSTPAKF